MGHLVNVAIDGHAGSGKTTVAVELARKLGMVYLDTGLMYRAVALRSLRQGLDLEQSAVVERLVETLDLSIEVKDGKPRMILDGDDVTDKLHNPEVNRAVPVVAAKSPIRRELVARQQAFAERGGIIMVGRDIASVVLPEAEVKVFLEADLKERARRRQAELEAAGRSLSLEEVEAELASRDHQDSTRADSPLLCVEGARRLDTTGRTVAEVVDTVADWINAHGSV